MRSPVDSRRVVLGYIDGGRPGQGRYGNQMGEARDTKTVSTIVYLGGACLIFRWSLEDVSVSE